jgi:SAM-dependent methyltransferase
LANGVTSIADVACGSGRNLLPFLDLKPEIHCYDRNLLALDSFKEDHPETILSCHEVDLLSDEFRLPERAFSLVLMIHFYDEAVFRKAANAVAPQGCFVFESIDNRGGNYLEMPGRGEVSAILEAGFEILSQSITDIDRTDRQKSKILARKRLLSVPSV